MRIKLGSGLLAINILAAILVVAIYFLSGNVIRVVLGLPLVLFFPGYILLAIMFPSKERITGVQRLTLSLGLSIIIVPLTGLVLNYTPWGMRLDSILYSLFTFVAIMSIVSWLRLRMLAPTDRMELNFTLGLPILGKNRLDRVLSIFVIIAILGTLGIIGYLNVGTKSADRFSEFYILGITGQATDYPTNFTLKDDQVVSVQYGDLSTDYSERWGRVTLGVVNHERQNTKYTVTLQVDNTQVNIPFQGSILDRIGPITLRPEEKWECDIGIVPQHAGDDQKVEISLYKDGGAEPYLNLHLWINVS